MIIRFLTFFTLVGFTANASAVGGSTTDLMLEASMQLRALQQQVHAENIANANKPGYVTQTVKEPTKSLELVRSESASSHMSLSTTNSRHIAGSKPNSKFKITRDPTAGELKPNGNNVDLVDQSRKASQNQVQYDTALKAYKSSAGLVKMVTSGKK